MPAKTLTPYEQVPVTKEDRKSHSLPASILSDLWLVDWAELITLDLGKFEKPGGKQELVKQLEHAVRHVGKSPSTEQPISISSCLTYIRILLRQQLQHQPGGGRPPVCSRPRIL